MEGLNSLQLIAIAALPLLFAITVHEVAHGWVAKKLGDPTAMMLGRLTLNPIKHIDPIGTVILPVFLLISGGFIFGWAKPVPVTVENFKNPHKDMALVAVAGPASNLLMALFWALIMKLSLVAYGYGLDWFAHPMLNMAQLGIMFNLILMVLNLLPIPPLDGGRIVSGFLPGPWAYKFNHMEMYGLIAVVALLMTGLLGKIIGPPIAMMETLIYTIFGL